MSGLIKSELNSLLFCILSEAIHVLIELYDETSASSRFVVFQWSFQIVGEIFL